jgi:hypothetical protein
MTKKAAFVLALIMLLIVGWELFIDSGATQIIINGEELTGPLKGVVGAGGLIVASIALFCAAIFLVFVFAGIGIFLLGGFIVFGLVMAWLTFPILLFMLLPLAIVWVFVAIVRHGA